MQSRLKRNNSNLSRILKNKSTNSKESKSELRSTFLFTPIDKSMIAKSIQSPSWPINCSKQLIVSTGARIKLSRCIQTLKTPSLWALLIPKRNLLISSRPLTSKSSIPLEKSSILTPKKVWLPSRVHRGTQQTLLPLQWGLATLSKADCSEVPELEFLWNDFPVLFLCIEVIECFIFVLIESNGTGVFILINWIFQVS